jgi:hypothetical protein
MPLFGNTPGRLPAEELDEIRKLSAEVAKLSGAVDALREQKDALIQVDQLKRTIVTLEIERDKKIEVNKREKRETEHEIGLLRKGLEQDREHQERMHSVAMQRATLDARGNSLTEEKRLFSEQMAFQRAQLESQIADVKDVMQQVFAKLPDIQATFTMDKGSARRAAKGDE